MNLGTDVHKLLLATLNMFKCLLAQVRVKELTLPNINPFRSVKQCFEYFYKAISLDMLNKQMSVH